MGAWGTGIFDDDTACDFLSELAGSKQPLDLMKRVLKDAPGSEYLEYDAGQGVLVSSAVIDTILNGTRHGDDRGAARRLTRHVVAPGSQCLKIVMDKTWIGWRSRSAAVRGGEES